MENTNIISLVQASVAGSKEAFSKLYEISNKRAYFVALCVTKNEDNAINIIQSSYITAYQRLTKLKYPQMFENWFNRIVSKNIFDELSDKSSLLFSIREGDYFENFDDEVKNIEEEMNDVVFSDKVNIKILEMLDKLAFDERLCFLMYYYFEMGVTEISKVLGISESIIIALLNRAKKKVRAATEAMISTDEGAKDFPPMVFFCKALLKCSSHVPFRATDSILDSIFGAIPVTPKSRNEQEHTKVLPLQNDNDATQMYTTEEMSKYYKQSSNINFTPYGSEYAKGTETKNSSTDKVTQSAGKAAKIAIIVAVVLVFAIAVIAFIKNVIVDKEKEKENITNRTTAISTTAQETEEYTTEQRATAEPTTEKETTTEETTTEETTTEEPTTEEPETEEPSYEEPETTEDLTEDTTSEEPVYNIV